MGKKKKRERRNLDHRRFSDSVGTQNSDSRFQVDSEVHFAEQNAIRRVPSLHFSPFPLPERHIVGLQNGHLQRRRLRLIALSRPHVHELEAQHRVLRRRGDRVQLLLQLLHHLQLALHLPSLNETPQPHGARFAFTRKRLTNTIRWSICPFSDARSRSRFSLSSSNVFSYAS